MADPQTLEHQTTTGAAAPEPVTDPARKPDPATGGFLAGRIPAVLEQTDAAGKEKTASERAYAEKDRITNPHDEPNKRSRAQLGPEEQGDFAKPYDSWAQALAAEAFLRTTLLPAVLAKFGVEVHGLWAAYLNRSAGASLAPRVFQGKGAVVESFKRCTETQREQQTLLSEIQNKLRSEWGSFLPKLPLNVWTTVPLAEFIGAPERELSTNFGDPHNIPGHIAGGVGSSDAGPDTRSVAGNVKLRRVNDTRVEIEPDFMFKCNDAIDFIPGNIGTRMESTFTVPLSRLEASGWAYDMPFEVRYHGPVAHAVMDHGAAYDDYDAGRFQESTRGDQIRGNTGNIPDVQTPGAKSSHELKQERDAADAKRKEEALKPDEPAVTSK